MYPFMVVKDSVDGWFIGAEKKNNGEVEKSQIGTIQNQIVGKMDSVKEAEE